MLITRQDLNSNENDAPEQLIYQKILNLIEEKPLNAPDERDH